MDQESPTAYWRKLSFIVWQDLGNQHYASWVKDQLPGPCENFAHEEKLGDMVEALLGIRWLLHLSLAGGHPLRTDRQVAGQQAWEEWLLKSLKE